MSIESKILESDNPQETISHHECFGCELISANGRQISMSRETQNPIYNQPVQYQAQYENILARYSVLREPEITCSTVVILTLLFVLPCILYVLYITNNSEFETRKPA